MRLVCVTCALIGAALLVATPARAGDAVPRQLIVGFKSSTSTSRAHDLLQQVRARVVRSLPGIRAFAVRPRGDRSRASLGKALRRLRAVRYAEHDFYLRTSATPNDPLFAAQYGMPTDPGVSATTAWDHRTKCGVVATLDSGAQLNHPDLKGQFWHNPNEINNNGKDDDHNGYVDDYYGVDIYDGKGNGSDADGHGTHVAGIIGAHGNNAVGVAGVCWQAQIMPIRFMSANGRGSTSDAVAGIEYAIAEKAKIINCSFGSSSKSSALSDAVGDAKDKGALLVVAAGNDSENIDKTPEYPAAFTWSNVLTVAATTDTDTLASFSNFGSKSVDVAAPGDGIWSTYLNSTYKSLSGTSMAAPFVSGAAAMLRAKDSKLTFSDLKSTLKSTVDKLPALGGKTVTGGRIDLGRALGSVG